MINLYGNEAETKKPKRYVFYERDDPTDVDIELYANRKVNEIKEEAYPGQRKYMKGVYLQEGKTELPGMFNVDANRMAERTDMETIKVPLGYGNTADTIAKYTSMINPQIDEALIMGHSDPKNNRYGGVPLNEWGIPEGTDCYLGACSGTESGQSAANALGMPITAQNNKSLWSGTRKAKTTAEAMFYDYDDPNKVMSKKYYPE